MVEENTKEVPVYKTVSLRFRVAPFFETYTYQPPCRWVDNHLFAAFWYCPPAETRTRPVYNYVSGEPFQVQVGTETVTYTVTTVKYREVHDASEHPTPTVTPAPTTTTTTTTNRCPTGQLERKAIFSPTPNPLLIGYDSDSLPKAPEGKEWSLESATPSYGCYKLVDEGQSITGAVTDAVASAIRESFNTGKTVTEAIVHGYHAADRALYNALCVELEDEIALVGAGSALNLRELQGVKTAKAAALRARLDVATVTATGLWGVCQIVDGTGGAPNDDSDDDSVPGPASGLSASAGAGQIVVAWSASATTPAAGFGYRVQWKLVTQTWDQAAAQTEDLDHGSDLATSHTITGLANGSAYDVRVAAFNANGVSDWITGQATPAKPKPSLTFDSVSCASSGSGWVISVTWSKTPESLKPDIWASEAKNRGHRGRQTAVAGTSTTFDVPNAGWYQVGMQAKIAGNKKVGDDEPVRCR